MKYDYLIVGSGLFGSVCAYELSNAGYSVLVVDKRSYTGGNLHCINMYGIPVHEHGAHIFHTSDKKIWDYINNFTHFENFINSPIAVYNDEVYNLPFNMNTFNKIWPDAISPDKALEHIEEERKEIIETPKNLEEKAISLVGRTVYEKLIKEYTEKQWGKECKDLPASIITRLPVRLTYDNNYFDDLYQGVPINGYNEIFDKMLEKCDILLNCDFNENKERLIKCVDKVIYTGMIDEYYNFCFGKLEYRSLNFKHYIVNEDNLQGNAVVNYTSKNYRATRMIEHKHFYKYNMPKNKTVVTMEFPTEYKKGLEAYYPINSEKNNELFKKYKNKSLQENKVIFGGRLGNYKYYDMDDTIREALKLCEYLKG